MKIKRWITPIPIFLLQTKDKKPPPTEVGVVFEFSNYSTPPAPEYTREGWQKEKF